MTTSHPAAPPPTVEASVAQTEPEAPEARKTGVTREDVMAAALKLLGPHRSVSTLSLREVARAAGIAPNSFYRHFRDMDELAVALIDQAGGTLRKIIREARLRASAERSIIRSSVEIFMEQLEADERLLHILLREGTVGSDAFKHAVERELQFFEDELRVDLIRIAQANHSEIFEPALAAKAITRLVFAMGGTALDLPKDQHPEIVEQTVIMLRMILTGARVMATGR